MRSNDIKCGDLTDRRAFVRTTGAGLLGLAMPSSLRASASNTQSQKWIPLGELAAAKNIAFGFAINQRLLTGNSDYAALVGRECTMVTCENAMKWQAVHPAPDTYTFEKADDIVRFAEAHSIKVHGHNLCWHRALPDWVTRDVNKGNAEATLRKHIGTVAGHYKGRLHSWDVVNEAIQLRDNFPNGLRNSFWYSVLGPAYIDIAFDAAQQTDSTAILTYNDYGLEYENDTDAAKRKAVLALLRDLKKRGVPIQALGMQAHLRTGAKLASDLPRFIAEVRDLGLKVFVTELDVDDANLTTQGAEKEAAIGEVYKRYLDLVLKTRSVSAVVTWGAWDASKVAVAGEPASEWIRALLFAPGGQPKEEAFVVSQSLRQAPVLR